MRCQFCKKEIEDTGTVCQWCGRCQPHLLAAEESPSHEEKRFVPGERSARERAERRREYQEAIQNALKPPSGSRPGFLSRLKTLRKYSIKELVLAAIVFLLVAVLTFAVAYMVLGGTLTGRLSSIGLHDSYWMFIGILAVIAGAYFWYWMAKHRYWE